MITPEYYVRQLNFETWEVAKFEASDSPSAVYTIRLDLKGRLRCSCPRWLRKSTTSCKHTAMVKDYINKEQHNDQSSRRPEAGIDGF